MKDFDMRVWDKKHEKMLYWHEDFAYITHRMIVVMLNGGMLMPPDHEILLSTTKKDKNKKTIFEGDIVQSNYGELFEIVWEGFMFVGRTNDRYTKFTLDEECLIVGNVYEGPIDLRSTSTT